MKKSDKYKNAKLTDLFKDKYDIFWIVNFQNLIYSPFTCKNILNLNKNFFKDFSEIEHNNKYSSNVFYFQKKNENFNLNSIGIYFSQFGDIEVK